MTKPAWAQSPEAEFSRIVVDLDGDVRHLDPALTYTTQEWSIIHSIYDALVEFGADGSIKPLAAESFSTEDAITFAVRLRSGMTFHDGTPVTTAAISRSIEHMRASESQVADLIRVVDRVEQIDDLNAKIVCSEPAAWLPSQLAVWQVLLPESFTLESLETNPVGSGPYTWGSYDPGNEIVLHRNPDYAWGSPKGVALADEVVYRIVPDSATRVADLATGQANIIARIPTGQAAGIEGAGGIEIIAEILATAFVRIATDAPPFDDPLVRRALNHAVDVQTIASALASPSSYRLASFYPDARAMGFDPQLEPFAYDPELARDLLGQAGYPNGFSTMLEVPESPSVTFAEAIAPYLGAVGIDVEIVISELGAFNAGWGDSEAPPLRYASWRPLYDPNTFLSLVVSSEGFLSRYSNSDADALIAEAAAEPDADGRNALYQELGQVLYDDPAAIYLWNAVTRYGVSSDFADWKPRGDDYIVLTDSN